jgi:membrane fusion protein (multidrug efflux system)
MNDPIPEPGNSITPAAPEVIALREEPTPPRRPRLVLFLGILGVVLVIALLAGIKVWQISGAIAKGKAFRMPPDAVTSLVVAEEPFVPTLDSVGSLATPQGVMLGADQPGTVASILFESGSHATNGQILVRLDTRQEEAQLHTAQARLELARHNLSRNTDLRAKNVIAEYAYEEAKTQFEAAQASVDEIRAMIDRKTIRAPFSGELGIRQINTGQYLRSGDPVVQLESLDPIYVNFALPQQNLGKLAVGEDVRVMADGIPGRTFPGKITAINSAVDTATRNIQAQATLPNPDHLLRAGMFGAVQVVLPGAGKVIMAPSSAIQYAPYGDSLFVIETMKDPAGKEYLGVREQQVVLGRTRGDQVEVVSGLRPGDRIATSGIFKLRPGGAVLVNDSVQPGNDPKPNPSDS